MGGQAPPCPLALQGNPGPPQSSPQSSSILSKDRVKTEPSQTYKLLGSAPRQHPTPKLPGSKGGGPKGPQGPSPFAAFSLDFQLFFREKTPTSSSTQISSNLAS